MSELHLLSAYGLHKTVPGPDPDHGHDQVSKRILTLFDPEMSENYATLKIYGDGNCLYRGVSSALFGTDVHHKYLRLLTGIELIMNRNCYDTGKPDNNFLNDIRIVTSPYRKLVSDALKGGEYSEIGHIYAALQIPIEPCFPLCAQEELSAAFCRLVCGRDVNCMETSVHVMWTSTCVPVSKDKLSILYKSTSG